MSETTNRPTFTVELPHPEPPKGEREYQAFLCLLPELLATYEGRYVAIHNGQVVDSDADDAALILRVQAEVGYVPLYVGLVTRQQPIVRVPHYHEQNARE